jgi:hypothetical protein
VRPKPLLAALQVLELFEAGGPKVKVKGSSASLPHVRFSAISTDENVMESF